MFNIDIINNIVSILPIQDLIAHARFKFPGESCGFFFSNGGYYTGHNVIDKLNIPSITHKNAFMIDEETCKRAFNRQDTIGIFHSHTDGSSDMSESDRAFLSSPSLCYLIIGIKDYMTVSMKIHWLENNNLLSTNIVV